MSGDDAFDRAVKALRETGETTSPADVARTRMRVMETLHRGERRGRRTMWVLLPIAAVLAGSTALAKNPELARRVWTGVAETVGIAEPSENGPALRMPKGHGRRGRSTVVEPSEGTTNGANDAVGDTAPNAAPPENAAPSEDAAPALADRVEATRPAENSVASADEKSTEEKPTGGEKMVSPAERPAARGSSPAASRRPRQDGADRAAAPVPSNPPPETIAPEAAQGSAASNDGEAASLELYKKAYRLHFVEQRYAAALAAWDDYLRAAPAGRLVVEARYNRAIALVRLGRRADAEAALAPFARGEVSGGYRAREARELLDALNGSSR